MSKLPSISVENATAIAKGMKKSLNTGGFTIPLSAVQEAVAHAWGARDFNTLCALARPENPSPEYPPLDDSTLEITPKVETQEKGSLVFADGSTTLELMELVLERCNPDAITNARFCLTTVFRSCLMSWILHQNLSTLDMLPREFGKEISRFFLQKIGIEELKCRTETFLGGDRNDPIEKEAWEVSRDLVTILEQYRHMSKDMVRMGTFLRAMC